MGLISIIASSPPAILIAFGGFFYLLGISGAFWFVISGIGLQALWILKG